ncbi:MAG: alkaline phosphatase family protein [Candidatus Eisenbacteria sp.]|nr:alkaline phosphatase family protein [Candidatus Eisenbacteria bacterium]
MRVHHRPSSISVGAAAALALLGLAAGSSPAAAYVGPGAGFAVVGSLGVIFVTFFLALAAIVTWPFRAVIRAVRRLRSRRKTSTKRVIILGLDGLDPGLIRRWMREGHLPNLARLAERGTFHNLATTFPSMSPVAWSSFATGVDASKHNIFDFLNRDLRSHMPVLSSTDIRSPEKVLRLGKYEIPISKPAIRFLRKSKSFWQILGEHYVPCHVLRVPITFPPEKVPNGALLSAMCVPDLRGTQGSFTFYTTDPQRSAAFEGGTVIHVEQQGNTIRGEIPGPPNPITRKHEVMKIPFTVEVDAPAEQATVTIGAARFTLKKEEFSEWTPIEFRPGLGQKVRGIARFRVMEFAPHFSLYISPINFDPESPPMPISYPGFFASYLARLNGSFATLGLAEDTWALNEQVIDEDTFLDYAWKIHEEREKMWFNSLKKNRSGLNVIVFDGTDRLQHMFFRYLSDDHPANRGKDTERHKHALLDLYRRADDLVGRTLEYVKNDENTAFFVLSDHGFKPFKRGINLNSWFLQNGYMASKNGDIGRYFDGVDWSRTKAYTFGLAGIYINVKGRETDGTVDPQEEYRAVKAELVETLSGLKDPETGRVGILRVYDGAEIFRGPYRRNGPDLIVGYNVGYRASWDGAVGAADGHVFADNIKSWSGDHCIDPFTVPGIFFSNRKIKTDYPGIMDFAPTVLDLFGIDKPAHMDGISLFDEQACETRNSPRDAYFPRGVPSSLAAEDVSPAEADAEPAS